LLLALTAEAVIHRNRSLLMGVGDLGLNIKSKCYV